jgi:hypothetical protein
MHLLTPKQYYNPLQEILNLIPNEGVKLTQSLLTSISILLNKAGIVCTEFDDVVQVLKFLEELQLVHLEKKWTTLTLYKVKYGN